MTTLFGELEFKEDKEEAVRTGAMIALRPRQDHIDRLALVEGEPAEELHTTLLYLGKAADYDYDLRRRIVDVMRQIAERTRYVVCKGFGVNGWNAADENSCIVLGLTGKELAEIRDEVVKGLMGFDLLQVPEQHEPWIPHITLKYTSDFSEVPDLVDLQGEVVFDAIRVAFGGIVDDIPLVAALSTDDGLAGNPNRYAAAGLEGKRTVRVPVPESMRLDIKGGLGKCRYCDAKATKKVGIDGGAWLGVCDDEDHQSRARKEADGEMEEKAVRLVRTAAGAKRFGQPIGSVIVSDGSKLKHVKTETSEYDGFNQYNVGGKKRWIRKEGSSYVAYDENDNEVGAGSKEEDILKAWDNDTESANAPAKGKRRPNTPAPKAGNDPGGLKKVESEYDGYDKFMGQNGEPVYRDQATGKFYDADDNEVDVNDYNGERGKAEAIGAAAKKPESALSKKPGAPYGFKEAESEYDGYTKYVAGDGTPVYRNDETLDYYDANDKKLSTAAMHRLAKTAPVQTDKGGTVSREEAGKTMHGTGKKPTPPAKASAPAKPDPEEEEPKDGPAPERSTERRTDKQADKAPAGTDKPSGGTTKPKAPTTPQKPAKGGQTDDAPQLPAPSIDQDALTAVLEQVANTRGKHVPAEVIAKLRALAHRERDIRNKRKLMLYAQQLSDRKAFASLAEMDPWLRASALEIKLITPGGRIGSDRSLGSRSNGKNWVENTSVGRLPKYIRIVANGIKGGTKSHRIALAVAAVKRWARGGGNVSPKVQAAAAKAVAQWEALKAQA